MNVAGLCQPSDYGPEGRGSNSESSPSPLRAFLSSSAEVDTLGTLVAPRLGSASPSPSVVEPSDKDVAVGGEQVGVTIHGDPTTEQPEDWHECSAARTRRWGETSVSPHPNGRRRGGYSNAGRG